MHHKRLSQKTLCNVKISGIHPTKIICSRTGAAAHSKAEGEILERKKWPEPTRALGGRGPVCNIKGKEYVDEFLDFRKRTDKQYSCFFFFFFGNKLFISEPFWISRKVAKSPERPHPVYPIVNNCHN